MGGAGSAIRLGAELKRDGMTWNRPSLCSLVPADAGTQFLPSQQAHFLQLWIPAFAGMSGLKFITI
jgi:hypothetical protein